MAAGRLRVKRCREGGRERERKICVLEVLCVISEQVAKCYKRLLLKDRKE